MSPYQRNGTWYADYVDENGKRQRPSLGELAKTLKQAKEVERRLMSKVDEIRLGLASRDRNPNNLTVKTALEWYLEGPAAKQKNIKILRYAMTKHVTDPFASMRIDMVKPGNVADWLDEREDLGDLSPATVNRLRSYLMGMFTRLIKRDLLLGDNPVKRVDIRAVEQAAPRGLPAYVVPIIIDNASSPAWKLIFTIAAYTGMRRGEIRRLRCSDIDLERGTIMILKTKSGRNRVCPIHPELRAVLTEAVKGKGVLVPRAAWDQSAEITRAAMARGGVEISEDTQACFHSLRHTFANVAADCSAEPWAIEWVTWGPKTTSTMETTYLKPIASLSREISKLHYPRGAEVKQISEARERAKRNG